MKKRVEDRWRERRREGEILEREEERKSERKIEKEKERTLEVS